MVALRDDVVFVFETESDDSSLARYPLRPLLLYCNRRRHAANGRHFALLKQISSRIQTEITTTSNQCQTDR